MHEADNAKRTQKQCSRDDHEKSTTLIVAPIIIHLCVVLMLVIPEDKWRSPLEYASTSASSALSCSSSHERCGLA